MKLCIVFLAILGLGLGLPNHKILSIKPSHPINNKDLSSDFDDFLELIPGDQIFFTLLTFLDDTEVQQTITYMFGNEFRNIIAELDTIDEFNAVVDYLDDAGIPASVFFENLREILGITKNRSPITGTADLGGMKGLVIAIGDTIPWDEMRVVYDDKMENSEDFQKFVDDMTSDEFKDLWQAMVENERMQEISAMLKAGGVDIGGLIRLVKEFFNLQ